ECLIQFVNTV
ncbi:unnamed protein product, partial [Arctia plantaginis]